MENDGFFILDRWGVDTGSVREVLLGTRVCMGRRGVASDKGGYCLKTKLDIKGDVFYSAVSIP